MKASDLLDFEKMSVINNDISRFKKRFHHSEKDNQKELSKLKEVEETKGFLEEEKFNLI